MNARSPHRRARRNVQGPAPERLRLNLPEHQKPDWRDGLWAVGAAAALAGLFFALGHDLLPHPPREDEVRILETEPPPPPAPKEIPKPPKPVPPPREKAPPPPKEAPPPPPQFGLEKEATEGKGDMAVATGNTLLKESDSLVKLAPPPPPPEPLRLDQEPEATEKVMPEYPAWAEEQGVTSRVLVMVTIDAEGKVIDARVERSGGKDFDQAALRAANRTRYKPFVEKGKPLPAKFTVAYEFVL